MPDVKKNYAKVLKQYQDYPMPIRSAEDDRNGKYRRPGDNGRLICNLLFGGRNIFADNPRILIAGGGTGDSTLFFARLLKQNNSTTRVVHLDQSPAANRHCAERLRRLDLDNVDILEQSLYDLDPKTHGEFDYINCNGVLHHLDDPSAGLRSLLRVTAPTGGLGIWIYAKYGRTGGYHLQRLMADYFGDEEVDESMIDDVRRLIATLPSTSLGLYDPVNSLFAVRGTDSTTPDRHGEQVVDQYLNPSDHPHSAAEMFRFLEDAGAHFAGFQHVESLIYEPEYLDIPPRMKSKIMKLPLADRAEFAERWHCQISMHRVYATKSPVRPLLDPETTLRKVPDEPIRDFISRVISEKYYASFGRLTMSLPRALLLFLDSADGTRTNRELADHLGISLDDLQPLEHHLRNLMPNRIVDVVPD